MNNIDNTSAVKRKSISPFEAFIPAALVFGAMLTAFDGMSRPGSPTHAIVPMVSAFAMCVAAFLFLIARLRPGS